METVWIRASTCSWGRLVHEAFPGWTALCAQVGPNYAAALYNTHNLSLSPIRWQREKILGSFQNNISTGNGCVFGSELNPMSSVSVFILKSSLALLSAALFPLLKQSFCLL